MLNETTASPTTGPPKKPTTSSTPPPQLLQGREVEQGRAAAALLTICSLRFGVERLHTELEGASHFAVRHCRVAGGIDCHVAHCR